MTTSQYSQQFDERVRRNVRSALKFSGVPRNPNSSFARDRAYQVVANYCHTEYERMIGYQVVEEYLRRR